MAAKVTIGGDATELIRQVQALQKEVAKLKNQGFKETTKESKEFERVGKRAFESTRTAAEKYTITQKQLLAAVKAGKISLDTYNRSIDKASQELKEATQDSDKFGSSVTKQALAMGAGLVSVSAAVNVVREAFQAWQQDIQDIADKTKTFSQELVTFAALQTPGTSEERARQVVTAAAGALDKTPALDLEQSLQSAAGSFEAGFKIFEEVIAASRAGLPADVGGEAAIQALAAGDDPLKAIRLTLAAGQASGRSAAEVGLAAPALAEFNDKEFGFAVAAQLSGTFGRDVKTFTDNAGRALSDISGLKETFDQLGVGEGATREERLQALANAGLDTQVELFKAGLKQERQLRAISNLVTSLDNGQFQGIREGIAERLEQGRGLFTETQARIERENPFVRASREQRRNEALADFEQSTSVEGAAFGEATSARALALRQQGRATGVFGASVTTENRLNLFKEFANETARAIGIALRGPLSDQQRTLLGIESNTNRAVVPTPEAGAQ